MRKDVREFIRRLEAVGPTALCTAVLTGFKNRVLVLAHWTIAFLSRSRTERAIIEQQVFGRQALAASVPGGEVVD